MIDDILQYNRAFVERIERIRKMEASFNRVRKAVDALEKCLDEYCSLRPAIKELEEYQSSGLWLGDFEADERGELPKDLLRGVLSEDGLYNLLEEVKELAERQNL